LAGRGEEAFGGRRKGKKSSAKHIAVTQSVLKGMEIRDTHKIEEERPGKTSGVRGIGIGCPRRRSAETKTGRKRG